MAKIIYTAFAEIKLKQLIYTLYDEEYFGFVADAESYVHKIYDFINTIPLQRQKHSFNPAHGAWYCRYQHNKKTFGLSPLIPMAKTSSSGILSIIMVLITHSLFSVSNYFYKNCNPFLHTKAPNASKRLGLLSIYNNYPVASCWASFFICSFAVI